MCSRWFENTGSSLRYVYSFLIEKERKEREEEGRKERRKERRKEGRKEETYTITNEFQNVAVVKPIPNQ